MTEEELAQYGMKRVGNTFTQTTGNPRIGGAQPRLPGPMPGSALGPSLRPNWVPGGGSIPVGQATELGAMRLPAPGSIPVGQATELGGVRMPAPGSIPVGQATEVGQHPGANARVGEAARTRAAATSGPLTQKPASEAPSARARAFNPAMPGEGVAAQGTRLQRAVAAGTRAARVGVGVVPGIAAVAANRLADSAFAPAPGTDGPGAPTGTAVDQIPGGADPRYPTPPPQDPSFFRDTEIGRNIGNAVSAIPGGASAANTLRAGSGAAKAVDIAMQAGRAMQSDNAMRQPEPLPMAFPPGWGQGGRKEEPLSPETQAAIDAARQAREGQPNTAGEPSSNPLITNGKLTGAPEPGDGSIGTSLRAAAISEDNAALAMRNGAYGPGNHNADGTGGVLGGGMAWNKHNEDYDRNQMLSAVDRAIRLGGRRGPEQAMAIKAAYEAGQGQDNRKSAENIAGMRETGDLSRAGLAAGVSRANNRDTVAATLRGQESTLLGHKMTNDFDRTKLAQEQDNKDRQYKFDVAKFGAETADKNLAATNSAQKATQDHLETLFRTTNGEGKDVPDHPRIAAYSKAAETTLAEIIKLHEAAGGPENLAKARELKQRGVAALDAKDHAMLKQLFDRRDRVEASRGMLRGGARNVASDNLLDYEQVAGPNGVEHRMLGGDRIKLRGGSEISVNDLRYTEPSNRILPDWFKSTTNDYTRDLRNK